MLLIASISSIVSPGVVNAQGNPGVHVSAAHKGTVRVAIRPDQAKALAGLKVTRPDGSVGLLTESSQAETPECVGPTAAQDWQYIGGNIDWYWHGETGPTDATDANWSGYANCVGVSYVYVSSDLLYLSNVVKRGTDGICGTYEGTGTDCGYSSTFGEWSCVGIGLCSGTYVIDMGITVSLPPGYSWTYFPSICSTIGTRDLLCATGTIPVVVPAVNP